MLSTEKNKKEQLCVKFRIVLTILLSSLLLITCQDDNSHLCQAEIDLGAYELTESAEDFIPYRITDSVAVFVDSLGNERVIGIERRSGEYINDGFEQPCDDNENLVIQYRYKKDIIQYEIDDENNGGYFFIVRIGVELDESRYEEARLADVLHIEAYASTTMLTVPVRYTRMIIDRGYSDYQEFSTSEYIEKFTWHDKSFNDVFRFETCLYAGAGVPCLSREIYYAKGQGLIGIQPVNNNELFFFDRFE